MSVFAAIDLPLTDSLSDPLALHVEGWLHAGDRHQNLAAIEFRLGGIPIGETRMLYPRPDVERALHLAPGTPVGFAFLGHAPHGFGRAALPLECWARFSDGQAVPIASRLTKLISHDHRENHYGILAHGDESLLFHRDDVYTSGASVSDANSDCVALLRRYLGPPSGRVLDVGCGFGSYGRALRAAGYDWLGVEVKESDCAELRRIGMPHYHVDGKTLPFEKNTFEATICIEVLEHIAEPEPFLDEIHRVTRRRALFSVPNVELIPYLHRYAVVPWHLLEGDHKNFFTRPSLRALLSRHFRHVEVISYAPIPLRTPEGVPLHNHLFAICEV